jgi:phosphoglycolate phosphatase-like HAD superfamily hydrolase
MTRQAPAYGEQVRARGRVLPGVPEALAALGALDALDALDGRVRQSVLTGNIRPLAEVKLAALGLGDPLDLAIGAYGDMDEVRAELVGVARARARASAGGFGRDSGRDFDGEATVLVGDTPLDVAAALATGARAVAVATGSFTEAELAAAGAHAVLPDLSDTERVRAAILGGGA